MNKHVTVRSATIFALILGAAISRLLPHPPNVTPLGALALFAGAYVTDKRLAVVIPLAAMALSDAIIGFHVLLPVVYLCVAATVWIGFGLRSGVKIVGLAARVLAGSILFFIVTNFGVWAMGTMYPHSFAGLVSCYVAAIPFFRNSLLGDVGFAALLFGSFVLAGRMVPAIREEAKSVGVTAGTSR